MTKAGYEHSATDPALLTKEGLLPTAEATTGEIPSEQEQVAHLSTALGYYDTAVLHDGFVRMAEHPEWRKSMERRYGELGFHGMLGGKMALRDEALMGAEAEYYSAYGLPARLAGQDPEAQAVIRQKARERYEQFAATFQGSSEARRQKRQEYQAQYASFLAGNVAVAAEATTTSERIMQPFQPQAGVNLSRALRPDFTGIITHQHDSVTMLDMQQAEPGVLLKSVVNVGSRRRNALAYPQDETNPRKLTNVVFSPRAWTMMLRSSADHRADIAVNKSKETQRALRQSGAPHDPDAPRRAGIHILETNEAKMSAYRTNIVEPTLKLIDRFEEAAKFNGNLLRFGNEANMRIQLDYLWNEAVDEMLWTVADVNGWDEEEERTTRLALEKAVFGIDDQAARLKNFGLVLGALKSWYVRTDEYIAYKQAEVERYYDKHQTPEERQAREQQRLQAAS